METTSGLVRRKILKLVPALAAVASLAYECHLGGGGGGSDPGGPNCKGDKCVQETFGPQTSERLSVPVELPVQMAATALAQAAEVQV